MSDLDDLLGGATEVAEATAPVAGTAPVVEGAVTEAAVTEDDFEFGDIPDIHRTGFTGERAKRGSKYGFDKFPAPKTGADGNVQYARKFVPFGADPKKTAQGINSAVSQHNGSVKKAGGTEKFTSRKAENGTGIYIIRTA